MYVNLIILSTKDTIILRDRHNSVTRVIHIYSADNGEIIDILKSLTSFIWSNAQLCRNIYRDNFDFSIVNIFQEKYSVNISELEVVNTFFGLELEEIQIDEIFG